MIGNFRLESDVIASVSLCFRYNGLGYEHSLVSARSFSSGVVSQAGSKFINITQDMFMSDELIVSSVAGVVIMSSSSAELHRNGSGRHFTVENVADISFKGLQFISGSVADGLGGCLAVDHSSITLQDTTFKSFSSAGSGGGIDFRSTPPAPPRFLPSSSGTAVR